MFVALNVLLDFEIGCFALSNLLLFWKWVQVSFKKNGGRGKGFLDCQDYISCFLFSFFLLFFVFFMFFLFFVLFLRSPFPSRPSILFTPSYPPPITSPLSSLPLSSSLCGVAIKEGKKSWLRMRSHPSLAHLQSRDHLSLRSCACWLLTQNERGLQFSPLMTASPACLDDRSERI